VATAAPIHYRRCRADRFFEEGDKVRVTLRFGGREMAHQDLGYKLLDRVKGDTAKIAKIEQEPRRNSAAENVRRFPPN
jgi:translation initiation factor IF-3